MTREEEQKELIKSLNDCLAFGCRPDEYQLRHNLLIRQLAAYVLREAILKHEDNSPEGE